MDPIYERIREKALKIVAEYPLPAFYREHRVKTEYALKIFLTDPVVCELREFVASKIENDFGHGLAHAEKVAQDAGALLAVEGEGLHLSKTRMGHCVRMAECAGLLHDIRRKLKNHAHEGAVYARKVLLEYPFSDQEITDISVAIENHEAFGVQVESKTLEGALLSDCLYDADKFRWGPDNFTHTVWDMVAFADIPPERFVRLYPKGMAFLGSIKATFRSNTGKTYGPQFIDLGLAIGRALYAYIKTAFPSYFLSDPDSAGA
jgi:hypothetical protein